MPNMNIDDLRDTVGEFESAVRSHENMGSQPIEDHAVIEEEYKQAEANLIGALVNLHANPAAAAIAYALDGENHEWDSSNQLRFLELWNEGEFETLRENWDNIPDEVFIGADTQFVPKPRICVGRHINGITLNSLEYILNDDGETLTFRDEAEARDYLLNYAGLTEDQISELSFVEVNQNA